MMSLPLSMVLLGGLASAGSPWPDAAGAGELEWGTTSLPVDGISRDRAAFLPDSGFIGARPGDRPTDLELPGLHPGGQRRYLRYVHGVLVDAWVVGPGPIDVSVWVAGELDWSGPVLGPGPDGWRSFGDATSWNLGTRTALHWRDRTSETEILAVRAAGATRYKAVRAEAVQNEAPPPTGAARLKGDLKAVLKSEDEALSGCLNAADKPVNAVLHVAFDAQGRPARLKVETDKVAPDVMDCMAGVVVGVLGPPDSVGSVTLQRSR